MKDILISEDIYPIAEFKKHASRLFKQVKEQNRPLVVTQNGQPVGVIVSPALYDDLYARRKYLERIDEGLRQAERGEYYTSEEVDRMLDEKYGPLPKRRKTAKRVPSSMPKKRIAAKSSGSK
ncbi:type II toxin-antitoxin system Phd/YefM family antitoxin [bacterium]|nr:type II toxin-antitoxin system Phd/YefM family antitoxin [bacterium]